MFISNLPKNLIQTAEATTESPYQTARALAANGSLQEAIRSLTNTKQGARDMTLHGEAITRGLRACMMERKVTPNYKLEDFPGLEDHVWDKDKALIS